MSAENKRNGFLLVEALMALMVALLCAGLIGSICQAISKASSFDVRENLDYENES